jgi:hypothetical protein
MSVFRKSRGLLRTITLSGVVLGAACVHVTQDTGAVPPGIEEFGLGPRKSAHGIYVASLEPQKPLSLIRMQYLHVRITDADGEPIDGATIAVGGGMPEHGDGLPTSPRVTRSHGDGVYQIDGVRFNRGGWWELRLAVVSTAGADTVTFNLDL